MGLCAGPHTIFRLLEKGIKSELNSSLQLLTYVTIPLQI